MRKLRTMSKCSCINRYRTKIENILCVISITSGQFWKKIARYNKLSKKLRKWHRKQLLIILRKRINHAQVWLEVQFLDRFKKNRWTEILYITLSFKNHDCQFRESVKTRRLHRTLSSAQKQKTKTKTKTNKQTETKTQSTTIH